MGPLALAERKPTGRSYSRPARQVRTGSTDIRAAGTVELDVRPLRHRLLAGAAGRALPRDRDPARRSSSPATTSPPGPTCPVVAERHGERVLDVVRWGLVPFWAKDPKIGDRMINARAETLLTSNAFKRRVRAPALHRARRRLLRVAEARGASAPKQPWFIRRRDGEPLAFAGLWETWHDRDGGRRRAAAAHVHDHHDRRRTSCSRRSTIACRSCCPEPSGTRGSTSTTTTPPRCRSCSCRCPPSELEAWTVSTLVNKADNNGPELLEPACRVASALMDYRDYCAAIRREGHALARGRARGRCRRARAVVPRLAGRRSARSRRPAAPLGRGDRRVGRRRSARSLVGRRAAGARRAARLVRRRASTSSPTRCCASSRRARRGRGPTTAPPASGPGARRTRPRCTAGTRSSRPATTEPIEHDARGRRHRRVLRADPVLAARVERCAARASRSTCTAPTATASGSCGSRADGVLVTREHAKGDVAMRAPASDLLLFLYGRVDRAGRRGVRRRVAARPVAAARASGEARRAAGYASGTTACAEHVDHVLAARRERVGRERVDVEQVVHERRVRQVRQHRAVAGEQQLAGVVAAQPAGVHLAFEERGAAVEQRAEQHRELFAEDRAALERLPAHEAHEVGVLLEEAERGAQHALDLRPTFARAFDRVVDERRPSRRRSRAPPRGRARPSTGSGAAGSAGGCRPRRRSG